jgi:hypothetical protein
MRRFTNQTHLHLHYRVQKTFFQVLVSPEQKATAIPFTK